MTLKLSIFQYQMSLLQEIQEIHTFVDQLANKFEKVDNTKALENQIQKYFKEVRQLISNHGTEGKEDLTKLMIDKQQKTKYILEYKKGLNTKELRQTHLKRLNQVIQKINKKIGEYQKNVASQAKQSNKRKKNYEKNMEYFKYHLAKVQLLKSNIQSNKLYSVQNIDALFDYLESLSVSAEDTIFQEDIEKSYNTMFVLADIKLSDLGQVLKPQSTLKQASSVSQESTKQQSSRPKQEFLSLVSISYDNLPRWNDYVPSNQTKTHQELSGVFPDYKMIDYSTISKMKDETLFFIFYYMKGEMEQYFAAKELKSRHWRYNTKYLNWFRRYGEPTLEMPDFQKATYVFFDYDKFSNRKRADFTMKFHQLEDKI